MLFAAIQKFPVSNQFFPVKFDPRRNQFHFGQRQFPFQYISIKIHGRFIFRKTWIEPA